ncbi:MAG: aromatic-L-amino-acid decarboxylase [Gammaproteobacteria bacterium]|jgi:aromatic-L-amino-acid decarboxylase
MKQNSKYQDQAEAGNLTRQLMAMGKALDQYLKFEHPDAILTAPEWKAKLESSLPDKGIGIDQLVGEINQYLIPNGAQIPYAGCTAYITTGATSAGVLATLAGTVAAPQRFSLTAFNYLEELSLDWMAELFDLPEGMKGLYSSGGSVANLVALGAARQQAFEKLGIDPAQDGINKKAIIFATDASHHTIHRAAAVLGLGRKAIITIEADSSGRMLIDSLIEQLDTHLQDDVVPVAIVANAGVTSTGAVDPLREIGELARKHSIWFHVDGAYGLPGVLDPSVKQLFDGLELIDSVIVDPHKWLGAPVGIGATFVRDRSLLNRAFSQGASDYLEGSITDEVAEHSMDHFGIPYFDLGVELSAPSRGAVVWAILREIGREGMQKRIVRHIGMARWLADEVRQHPNLELLLEPTLSICCFRFVSDDIEDLNEFNRKVYRSVVRKGLCIPSTAMVDDAFAIRPCFIGARTTMQHAEELLADVLEFGQLHLSELSRGDIIK